MSESSSSNNNNELTKLANCFDNYVLIDVGANLTNRKFGRDLESVVQRAKDSGVQKIIAIGSSLKSSKEALRLARIYPGMVYSTAGIHPHEAKSWDEDYIDQLRDLVSNSECVGIGECGLDYSRDFSTPTTQEMVFEKQLELACEVKKPVIIHEKSAHGQVMDLLNKYRTQLPATILHSYVGNSDQDSSEAGLQGMLESGELPMDRILVESDAPFLYPNARAAKLPIHVRDAITTKSQTFLQRYCTFQRNEPCSVPVLIEIIAAFLKKTPEEIALATSFTALKLFGLSS
ncbi:hypothetical protein M8J75_012078 [Diaphorina citri]|nr:hypothetical protein M8J75_012078 [Diaphorina citri]